MKKFFITILIFLFILCGIITYIILSDNNHFAHYILDNNYKKEVIERCQTFEEYENGSKTNEPDCLTSFDETFSPFKVKIAIDYAKKIKYAYRKEDINALSNILVYPVRINNYKNKNLTINTKKELLELDKNIISNKSVFDAIDRNKLFWNWQGYMLGNGEFWFWINDNNEIEEITINIIEYNTK